MPRCQDDFNLSSGEFDTETCLPLPAGAKTLTATGSAATRVTGAAVTVSTRRGEYWGRVGGYDEVSYSCGFFFPMW